MKREHLIELLKDAEGEERSRLLAQLFILDEENEYKEREESA